MSKPIVLCSVAIWVVIVARVSTAHADLAPPPSFGASCSVKQQATKDSPCESCSGDYRKPKACAQSFAGKALAFRCRTPGRTDWTEVWCRAEAGDQRPAPTTEPDASAPATSAVASASSPAPTSSAAEESGSSGWGCAVRSTRPSSLTLIGLLPFMAGWASWRRLCRRRRSLPRRHSSR